MVVFTSGKVQPTYTSGKGSANLLAHLLRGQPTFCTSGKGSANLLHIW